MNSKTKGSISEAIVLAKFMELEKTVFLPFGENTGVDMVVQDNHKLVKIQVKTGRKKHNSIEFESMSIYKVKGKNMTKSYIGEADMFAVYFPENKKVYFIPITKELGPKVYLSFAASNRHPNVKLAQDFEQWKVN